MKFVIGFLVAFSAFLGLFVGVVTADCSCKQLIPSSLGGEWGVTPAEWQRLVGNDQNQSAFYMNPAAREAAIRVYDGSDRPVLHQDWYSNNPRYFTAEQWSEYIKGAGY